MLVLYLFVKFGSSYVTFVFVFYSKFDCECFVLVFFCYLVVVSRLGFDCVRGSFWNGIVT